MFLTFPESEQSVLSVPYFSKWMRSFSVRKMSGTFILGWFDCKKQNKNRGELNANCAGAFYYVPGVSVLAYPLFLEHRGAIEVTDLTTPTFYLHLHPPCITQHNVHNSPNINCALLHRTSDMQLCVDSINEEWCIIHLQPCCSHLHHWNCEDWYFCGTPPQRSAKQWHSMWSDKENAPL